MHNQYLEVNANAKGRTCHNCDSPTHFLAQCRVPKCYICRTTWPNSSTPGYHHPFNCPHKQRNKTSQYRLDGSSSSFVPKSVTPTLPKFNYTPKVPQQSRGALSSAGSGGRGNSFGSSGGGGRGFGGRVYANNAVDMSVSADDLRQQFEIQHAANYAAAIEQVNAAFAIVDGEFQIQENVEYEHDESLNGSNKC